jgi:hypothetical protein
MSCGDCFEYDTNLQPYQRPQGSEQECDDVPFATTWSTYPYIPYIPIDPVEMWGRTYSTMKGYNGARLESGDFDTL